MPHRNTKARVTGLAPHYKVTWRQVVNEEKHRGITAILIPGCKGVRTMKKIDADYFKDWNYRKHAKFCTAIYLGLYAFDMTVSYFIIRKLFGKTASR